MRINDFSQLSFDFCVDGNQSEFSAQTVAALDGKVVSIARYLQAKEQESNGFLYQKIFDSIKHIG